MAEAAEGIHCLDCHSTCGECADPGDIQKCTTCDAADDRVIGPSPGPCEPLPCPTHMAESADGINCLDCHSSCVECSSPADLNKCTSCPTDELLVGATEGYCADECPTHTAKDPMNLSHCLECDGTCEECNEPGNSAKCTKCTSPKLLHGETEGECISPPCPDHYALDSTGKRCLGCHSSCNTCAVPNDETMCTLCNSGKYVLGVTTGECVADCPDHYAVDGAGERCLECDSSCEECAVPGSSTDCVSCPSGEYLVGDPGYCTTDCPTHMAIDPVSNTKCLECDNSCKECSIPGDPLKCTECESPNVVKGTIDGECIAPPCPDHYILSGDGKKCLDCDSTCLTCGAAADETQCTTCPSGKYLFDSTTVGKCIDTCPSHYAKDATDTYCLSCDSTCVECLLPGDADLCTSCISGDLLVGDTSGYCSDSGCPSHTAVDNTNTKCLPCALECDECSKPSDLSKCTACVSPKLLFGATEGTCVSSPCPTHYGPDSPNEKCLPCHNTCETCQLEGDISKCLTCPTDTYLLGSAIGPCVTSCPPHYALDSSGLKCFPCDSNCEECSVPSSSNDCTSCYSGKYLLGPTNGPCVSECPSGTALNSPTNDRCLTCDPSCVECSLPNLASSCTECTSGKFILGSSVGPCTSACPAGTALDSTDSYCLPCDGTCAECTIPGSSTSCTSCPSGTYLLGSPTGICTDTCPDGTAVNSPLNNKCLSCHGSCQKCNLPASENSCTYCAAGKYVHGSTAGPCISACPVGTSLNNEGTKCLSCDGSCFSCSEPQDPGKCTECSPPLVLLGDTEGSCIPKPCPSHYALDVDTGKKCLECSSLCKECVTPNNEFQCNLCESGKRLLGLESGQCIDPPCPTNTIEDVTHTKCLSCDSTCISCSQAFNAMACTQCPPDKLLFLSSASATHGNCISPPCPEGFAVSGSKCIPCHASCKTCCEPSNSQACTKCASGYLLGPGPTTCVSTCPDDYILTDDQICLKCHWSCSKCAYPANSTACKECRSGLYYYGGNIGECLETCYAGTAPDYSRYLCSPCHFTCKTCSAPYLSDRCINCTSGLVFFPSNSSCIPQCPDGYFLNQSSNTCGKCDQSCETCAYPGDQFSCLKCGLDKNLNLRKKIMRQPLREVNETAGYCLEFCPDSTYFDTVSKSACYKGKCPTGMFTNETSRECLECHSSCKECIFPVDPLKCVSCEKFLRVDTVKFNQTLAEENGGRLYGECVEECGLDDFKNETQGVCYVFPYNRTLSKKEEEKHYGYMVGVAADSSVYFWKYIVKQGGSSRDFSSGDCSSLSRKLWYNYDNNYNRNRIVRIANDVNAASRTSIFGEYNEYAQFVLWIYKLDVCSNICLSPQSGDRIVTFQRNNGEQHWKRSFSTFHSPSFAQGQDVHNERRKSNDILQRSCRVCFSMRLTRKEICVLPKAK
eukprot:TRINITY_DN426_c0_g1_i1.p1 TRINITY_DN426_c0_g1~~TRINITY_DN426_c0_g1_i1.p1  ORF type:complete len:1419 (+),score=48.84 TRINITY_DN426_c0_g1_i1:473-4729(+)